jgi:hypothetical protein
MMTGKLFDNIKTSSDRFELRLSGSGGQGMIFASVVLGEAIGLAEGKNVVQSQSYGPEARGGASKADVVVSSQEIFYPKAMKLDPRRPWISTMLTSKRTASLSWTPPW